MRCTYHEPEGRCPRRRVGAISDEAPALAPLLGRTPPPVCREDEEGQHYGETPYDRMHIGRDLHNLRLSASISLKLQHLERDHVRPEYAPQRTHIRQQHLNPAPECVIPLKSDRHSHGCAKIGKRDISNNVVVLEFLQLSAVTKQDEHAEAREGRRDGRYEHPQRHGIHRTVWANRRRVLYLKTV